MGEVGENHTESAREVELQWCNEVHPCQPHMMLGMSWWKCLGYNSVCTCVETFVNLGFEYRGAVKEYITKNYPNTDYKLCPKKFDECWRECGCE